MVHVHTVVVGGTRPKDDRIVVNLVGITGRAVEVVQVQSISVGWNGNVIIVYFPIARRAVSGQTVQANTVAIRRRRGRLGNRVIRNLTRINVACIHTVAHEPRNRVIGKDELLRHVARATVEVAHVRTIVDRIVVDGQRIEPRCTHVKQSEVARRRSRVAIDGTVLNGQALVCGALNTKNSAV